jgi:hypothetical protein
MLLDAIFYFFLLMLLAHIVISLFLASTAAFCGFQRIYAAWACKINYHGGDYRTLIDSYCSGMLVKQLVSSSGYVMLLQLMGTGEAPERIRSWYGI